MAFLRLFLLCAFTPLFTSLTSSLDNFRIQCSASLSERDFEYCTKISVRVCVIFASCVSPRSSRVASTHTANIESQSSLHFQSQCYRSLQHRTPRLRSCQRPLRRLICRFTQLDKLFPFLQAFVSSACHPHNLQ